MHKYSRNHAKSSYVIYMYSTCLNIHNVTVRKLLSNMTTVFFLSIENCNNRELDIKYVTTKMIIIIFPISNICFGCIKERSEGGVSLMHPKHMFL